MTRRIFGSPDLTPSLNSKQLSQALNLTANAPAIVALETGELTTLLFGMLGIGGA